MSTCGKESGEPGPLLGERGRDPGPGGVLGGSGQHPIDSRPRDHRPELSAFPNTHSASGTQAQASKLTRQSISRSVERPFGKLLQRSSRSPRRQQHPCLEQACEISGLVECSKLPSHRQRAASGSTSRFEAGPGLDQLKPQVNQPGSVSTSRGSLHRPWKKSQAMSRYPDRVVVGTRVRLPANRRVSS